MLFFLFYSYDYDRKDCSDPDHRITYMCWYFGDGFSYCTQCPATATHTYNEPGTYKLEIEVKDDFDPPAATWDECVIEVK